MAHSRKCLLPEFWSPAPTAHVGPVEWRQGSRGTWQALGVVRDPASGK